MEIFKELSESEKSLLVESLQEVSVENGTAIVKQGDSGDAFYIIKTGSVRVEAVKDGKTTIIKEHLGPSDYFGEMALLKDETRMASVIASAPTVVMKLDRATFTSLLGANADILTREADRRKREVEKAQRAPILMKDLKLLSILGVGTFGRVKLV